MMRIIFWEGEREVFSLLSDRGTLPSIRSDAAGMGWKDEMLDEIGLIIAAKFNLTYDVEELSPRGMIDKAVDLIEIVKESM